MNKNNVSTDLEYILWGVMHSVDKWLEGEELAQDEVNRAATMREKTLKIVETLQQDKERLQCLLLQFTSTISQWGNKYNIDTSEIPMLAIMQQEAAQAKKDLFAKEQNIFINKLNLCFTLLAQNKISIEEFKKSYAQCLSEYNLSSEISGKWLFINQANSYLEPPHGDTCKCSVCGYTIDASKSYLTACPNCNSIMTV